MTITNEQAQEWRELAEAATPGPWEPGVLSIPRDSVISVSENRYVCSVGNGGYWQQDAAFIAAARTAVPALLTERDALAAEVQQLRAQLDDAKFAVAGLTDVWMTHVYKPVVDDTPTPDAPPTAAELAQAQLRDAVAGDVDDDGGYCGPTLGKYGNW